MVQPPFISYYFFYAEKFINTQERFEGFLESTEVAGLFAVFCDKNFVILGG